MSFFVPMQVGAVVTMAIAGVHVRAEKFVDRESRRFRRHRRQLLCVTVGPCTRSLGDHSDVHLR